MFLVSSGSLAAIENRHKKNQNLVTKRDGSTERINLDKIHRVLDWAADLQLISQVELRSAIQFYDGDKTVQKPLSRLLQTHLP